MDMGMERNLFDIMQDFEPDDNLFNDNADSMAIERIKFRVFQKKGVKSMQKKTILKRLAVAGLACVLVTGSVVGADAATGGRILHGLKTVTLTILHEDGSEEEHPYTLKEYKKNDGTYEYELNMKSDKKKISTDSKIQLKTNDESDENEKSTNETEASSEN